MSLRILSIKSFETAPNMVWIILTTKIRRYPLIHFKKANHAKFLVFPIFQALQIWLHFQYYISNFSCLKMWLFWKEIPVPPKLVLTLSTNIDTVWKVSKYGSYFWSVYSWIRTDYGEIPRISPYSVQIQENMDQK